VSEPLIRLEGFFVAIVRVPTVSHAFNRHGGGRGRAGWTKFSFDVGGSAETLALVGEFRAAAVERSAG